MRKAEIMLTEHILSPLLTMDENALLICSAEDLKAVHFPYPDFAPYLTVDASEIERRQRIFRDLIQIPKLTDLLEQSLIKLSDLSEIFRKIGNINGTSNETILYSLLEIQFFTDAVLLLHAGCDEDIFLKIQSEALKNFFKTIERMVSDDQFCALRKLLDDTKLKLRSIRSVTVGVNLDAQLNVSEAGIVSINEEAFATASPLSKIFRKENPSEEFTCIASVGIKEIGGLTDKNRISLDHNFYSAMNDILRTSLRGLKRNIVDTVIPSIRSLLGAMDEVTFLVKGARYLQKLQKEKIPLSYPVCSSDVSIVSLYNPLLLDKIPRGRIVPSDVKLNDQAKVFVLTGPNSGGKTVYLTAIGTAQVLFQMGLPVPAQNAEMRIYQSILTHFIKNIVKSTESRLADETIRLKECLQRVSEDSLILLDEVFSSTSAYDALFLAEALLDYLAKIGCHAFYVTHLHELAVKIRNNGMSPYINALSAEISNGKRTYRITEASDEETNTSLARDVVMENGLGFLFES